MAIRLAMWGEDRAFYKLIDELDKPEQEQASPSKKPVKMDAKLFARLAAIGAGKPQRVYH